MNVIREANIDIINYMGGFQCLKDFKTYRLNKYVFDCIYKDEHVLYNTLTNCIVALRKIEHENMFQKHDSFCSRFLYENYFLVPEDYDEDLIVDSYRATKIKPVTTSYLDHVQTFVIFTTTRCNARCFYCYELGMKGKKHMTIETADKVVDFILQSTFATQFINLDWFGGEPMFNSDIIEHITYKVQQAGRQVKSSMISNAYLLNEEAVNHAVTYWNLQNIQVTLDGTEEVYNKTKAFIYKDDPSPFKTVISNIHSLLNHGVKVTIRLNVDNNNAANIVELINYLSKEFDGWANRGLSVYCFPIFEIGFERTQEEIDKLSEKIIEINNLLNRLSFSFFSNDLVPLKTNHCMVDSNDTVTIDPDGHVGLCEHHFDKFLFTTLDDPSKRNYDSVKHWQKRVENQEICKTCKLVPICLKVPDCPSHRLCRGKERDVWYNKIALGLTNLYSNWINNKSCNGNSCSTGNCPANNCNCQCNCQSNG